MRILFAATELAGFADNPAQEVRVNGSILFDAVDLVRAAGRKHYDRGNLSTAISFTVRHEFTTIEAAELFLLTHFDGLTKEGTCEIQCGTHAGDYTSVYFPLAVLHAAPDGNYSGLSVWINYTIAAGKPQLTAP